MLFNNGFLNETLEALDYVIQNNNEKTLIIGLPLAVKGALYNCACVIQNKKILGIIPKVNLVTLNELNEARYFTSGIDFIDDYTVVNILGEDIPFGSLLFENDDNKITFGIEICADLWSGYNPHSELSL